MFNKLSFLAFAALVAITGAVPRPGGGDGGDHNSPPGNSANYCCSSIVGPSEPIYDTLLSLIGLNSVVGNLGLGCVALTVNCGESQVTCQGTQNGLINIQCIDL